MNKSNDRIIGALDSKHVMSVILYLYENGPKRRTDIYQDIARNMNMASKIEYLKECGLIIEDASAHLSLSSSGENVARLLQCIEDVLYSNAQSSVISQE